MRLFTGISIAPHVLDNLDKVLTDLRPLAPLNWSPLENLHITSKFIGAWPDEQLAELTRTLESVPAPSSFTLTIARFGFLPNPHRPRVFFAGVQAGPEPAELARRIDDALAPLGVARENRAYTPHLTLARLRNENIRELREHIANMTNFDFGTFQVSEFHLYSSKPSRGGSVYAILATFPLLAASGSEA
jgi:RNA 2',3'-cyclic 3'-phosphodiesterase